jgi:DNA-binding winged helix-turn-helix (wHTH) protein
MSVLRKLQKKSKEFPKTSLSDELPNGQNPVYNFGSFRLDQAERQLLHNGNPVHLAPKAFDLLLVLIQHKGCLVTKERLLREVWHDVYVEEANLSVNVASLRKALEESDAEGLWIETVPKQGYRFVAPVSELACEEAPHLVGCLDVEHERIHSVAVLQFENEGCGPAGEYLCAGLAESITNSLSRSPDLRVMARHKVHSCHQCHIDPLIVGHQLGVACVLLGRILRLGDRLIVRTELVDVITGWQLWGEQYHAKMNDILTVQQELTAEISERLRARLSRAGALDGERPVSSAQPLSKHATAAS